MGCAEYLKMSVARQTVLNDSPLQESELQTLCRAKLLTMKNVLSSYNREIGKLGEDLSKEALSQRLSMNETVFTPAYHGLDLVFQDAEGKYVVVDSKATTNNNPFSLLHPTRRGTQLGEDWIRSKAQCMQNPNSAQYTPQNAKIGKELERALDRGEVRTMLVHANPETQEVLTYELLGKDVRQRDNWELVDFLMEE